jgi:hypothetical protein
VSTLTTCPACLGTPNREVFACIDRADGSATNGARIETCAFCGGWGKVGGEQAQRYMQGQEMRRKRVEAGLSVKEQAAAIGISARALNDLEKGRVSE